MGWQHLHRSLQLFRRGILLEDGHTQTTEPALQAGCIESSGAGLHVADIVDETLPFAQPVHAAVGR